MKLKSIFVTLIFIFSTFISFGQGLPEKVNATFTKLYLEPGSKSYTLYNDFYEIGYHDVNGTGGIINVLIDVEGKHIGTLTDESAEEEKKAELVETFGLDCSSPRVKIIETPEGDHIYYGSCYYADQKGEKTVKVIADESGEVMYKGSREMTY